MPKYPGYKSPKPMIGASWSLETECGDRATVWLADRAHNGREIWKWAVYWKDGSHGRSDWNPTKADASEEAKCKLVGMGNNEHTLPRFKRDPEI